MKTFLLTTLSVLLVCSASIAQTAKRVNVNQSKVRIGAPNVCTAGQLPILVTDGSSNGGSDFIDLNSSAYYTLNLKGGHSYSAEIWDSYDGNPSSTTPVLTLLANCAGGPTSSIVSSSDPDLTGTFGARISWMQPADGQEQLQVMNPDTVNGFNYYVRVIDTTLLNPRWSIFSGTITQYALINSTGVAISGVLTVTEYYPNAGLQHTLPVTIPPGFESFLSIANANANIVLSGNRFGFANLAFIGPAGAVTADAYFIQASGAVTPSTFSARNFQH
jgi:hypothetical protein